MKSRSTDKSRRAILKGIASLPVVAIAGYHGTTYAGMLPVDHPTAKALQYTPNSTVEGKTCSNCNLYKGGSAAQGPCVIFPGHDVAANGWCKSWVAKA
jgi:hypothetical protein